MGKITKSTTRRASAYGWAMSMAIRGSSPIKFVKLMANIANEERLIGLKDTIVIRQI